MQTFSVAGDVLDSLGEAVISTDRDGRIVAWNKAAERFFGYTRAEALGAKISELCPIGTPEEQNWVSDHLSRGEQIEDFSVRSVDRTGRKVELCLSALPASNPASAQPAVTYVLRRYAHTLKALTDVIADIVWTTDANGTGTYLSPRFRQFIAGDSDSHRAIQNHSWMSGIVHPSDGPHLNRAWNNALRSGQPFECEARLRRFDGTYRWFVVRCAPVTGNDDHISEWIGSCTDIDDLKRGEQALLRSNEELRQFAYAAAHDMQEPLRNVANCVGMLSHVYRHRFDAEAAQWLEASIEGTKRMHEMVKDLLTFSTILDHNRPISGTSSLQRALTIALQNLAAPIREARASITVCQLPALGIEEEHGIQLFENLIGNSLKYRHAERDPMIQISASEHETGWLVTVSDNGIGFDPAYATQIFRIFKRLHGRAEYPGNGIGLAICARIVSHYGGRIWAESSLGQGAHFHFTLPGYYS